MSDRSSSNISPELWAGIVTLMPVFALYMRSVLAELGKITAQVVWKFIAGKRQRQQGHSTVIVVLVGETDRGSDAGETTRRSKGGDSQDAVVVQVKSEEQVTLHRHS